MKHPKYRVADILDMDSQVRDELFSYVKIGVNSFLPKSYVKDIMMVGSYTFGCASLSSDFDFNISCSDKTNQKKMWKVWKKGDKMKFSKYFNDFSKLWGIHIDFHYNENEDTKSEIYISLRDNTLYNRQATPLSLVGKFTIPPVVKHRLRWNTTTNTWDKLPVVILGKWITDEFAENIQEWKTKYGRKFITYKRIGNSLIQE